MLIFLYCSQTINYEIKNARFFYKMLVKFIKYNKIYKCKINILMIHEIF